MIDDTQMKKTAILKGLAHPVRMSIVEELATREMCVCDIAARLKMTQSAISHQLRLLKQAKLVRSKRSGKASMYSLADDHVRSILGQGMEHVAE